VIITILNDCRFVFFSVSVADMVEHGVTPERRADWTTTESKQLYVYDNGNGML